LGSVNGENVTEADWQIAANFTEDRLKRIYGEDFDLSQLDEDIQINQIKARTNITKSSIIRSQITWFYK
jgi:hypothetical protein